MPLYSSQNLIHGIVLECHSQFKRLAKHGKPTRKSNGQEEWTILAGIVLATPIHTASAQGSQGRDHGVDNTINEADVFWEIECISLATGSKCLPQSKQSPRGDLVNDCHAEVLARRGFNRWCLTGMRSSIDNPEDPMNRFRYSGDQSSVSEGRSSLFELVNPQSRFHLYVSQAPCGDATTASLAMTQTEESRSAFLKGRDAHSQTHTLTQEISVSQASRDQILQAAGSKHLRETSDSEDAGSPPLSKQSRIESSLARGTLGNDPDTKNTSACSLALGFRRGRVDYDSVGVLRTKPGRVDSEPTASMSCSDKIARWNILGLCSSLVAPFLQPIYLHAIITREHYDANALRRALFERIQQCDCSPTLDISACGHSQLHPIQIHESSVPFEFSREVVTIESEKDGRTHPPVASSLSISWIASEPSNPEVLANGCKAGASAKQPIHPKAQSRLCKASMFKASVDLWRSIPESALSKLDQYNILKRVLHPIEGESKCKESGTLPNDTTYGEWKGLAKNYTAAKERLLNGVFHNWVGGDNALELFNIHGTS